MDQAAKDKLFAVLYHEGAGKGTGLGLLSSMGL
jgi:hypothetical protein